MTIAKGQTFISKKKKKDAAAAVEKAVQFTIDRDKFLRGRTVKVTYFTRLLKDGVLKQQ